MLADRSTSAPLAGASEDAEADTAAAEEAAPRTTESHKLRRQRQLRKWRRRRGTAAASQRLTRAPRSAAAGMQRRAAAGQRAVRGGSGTSLTCQPPTPPSLWGGAGAGRALLPRVLEATRRSPGPSLTGPAAVRRPKGTGAAVIVELRLRFQHAASKSEQQCDM